MPPKVFDGIPYADLSPRPTLTLGVLTELPAPARTIPTIGALFRMNLTIIGYTFR